MINKVLYGDTVSFEFGNGIVGIMYELVRHLQLSEDMKSVFSPFPHEFSLKYLPL